MTPDEKWKQHRAFYESNPVSDTPNLSKGYMKEWKAGRAKRAIELLASKLHQEFGLTDAIAHAFSEEVLYAPKLHAYIAPKAQYVENIIPTVAWFFWLRRLTGLPLDIACGYRHPAYDIYVAGKEDGRPVGGDGAHTYFKALDILLPTKHWTPKTGRLLFMAALFTAHRIHEQYAAMGHVIKPTGIQTPIGLGLYSDGGDGNRIHIDLNYGQRHGTPEPRVNLNRRWSKQRQLSAEARYKEGKWLEFFLVREAPVPQTIITYAPKFTKDLLP